MASVTDVLMQALADSHAIAAILRTQLDQARARIAELEKPEEE